MSAPSVFISYSHDSAPHKELVKALADRLTTDGLEVWLDQYLPPGGPPEGWPTWMENAIEQATSVLVVCTPTYLRRYQKKEIRRKGKGVIWEGAVLKQSLYDAQDNTSKFAALLLRPEDEAAIPSVLRQRNWYCVESEGGYDSLYRFLTNQPETAKPERGQIKTLPTRPPAPIQFPPMSGHTGATPSNPAAGAQSPPRSALTSQRTEEALFMPSASFSGGRWILVAGSEDEKLPPGLVKTCETLGRALAEAGFGLISTGWKGVDSVVSRAFSESLRGLNRRPFDWLEQYVQHDRAPSYSGGKVIRKASEHQAWDTSIRRADAIVLLGGKRQTRMTGEAARDLDKPVLPIADVAEENHDAAAEVYQRMVKEWGIRPISDLSLGDFTELASPLPGVAGCVIQLLEKLFGTQSGKFPVGESQDPSTKEEQRIARITLVILEDKGVLFNQNAMECPTFITRSVADLRKRLLDLRISHPVTSPVGQSIERMLDACRVFMNSVPRDAECSHIHNQLLALRQSIAVQLLELRNHYSIPLDSTLDKICAATKNPSRESPRTSESPSLYEQ